jgi:ubiquinone/menaquinone biosynthesis C-methylase UbiE
MASALGLFLELVFIRWLASEIRVFAFYKNFALIGAFLGLGLGFAAARGRPALGRLRSSFLPILVANCVLILALGRTEISDLVLANPANAQEFIWAGSAAGASLAQWLILRAAFYGVLWAVFVLITVMFVPLGMITARCFRPFTPLRGYVINILGSLAGILLVTLISFLGWPPAAWFGLAGLGAAYFFMPARGRARRALAVALAAAPALLTWVVPTGAARTLWSPYYRIDINPQYAEAAPGLQLGYQLSVNQAWHQILWDLDPGFVAQHQDQAAGQFDEIKALYDSPYQVADRLDRVLVVGAGTGNDVAAALRAGAGHVTAVEIDPLILDLGRQMHPEQPYADPARVTLVNQDARAFFRQDNHQYDLIVFGLLDSHTVFSSASSVRLDNFVYTEQSLREVRSHLAPGGLLAMTFGVPPQNEWIGYRLSQTLALVFGHPPQVYAMPKDDVLYLVKLDPIDQPLLRSAQAVYQPSYGQSETIDITTDDWPFLYLREKAIPLSYVIGLAGVVVLGLLMTRMTIPSFRQFDPHFFFLGAAFFLLETKSITELALLFGSTWIVNAAVIAAILFVIVLANLLVERFSLKRPWPFYVLLALALCANYLFPVGNFLGLDWAQRIVLASLSLALPLFFAGLVFAITFSQTASVEIALGSNLIGAVLGGIFEYVSLALGIRVLYLFALLFYLLSAAGLTWRAGSGARRQAASD